MTGVQFTKESIGNIIKLFVGARIVGKGGPLGRELGPITTVHGGAVENAPHGAGHLQELLVALRSQIKFHGVAQVDGFGVAGREVHHTGAALADHHQLVARQRHVLNAATSAELLGFATRPGHAIQSRGFARTAHEEHAIARRGNLKIKFVSGHRGEPPQTHVGVIKIERLGRILLVLLGIILVGVITFGVWLLGVIALGLVLLGFVLLGLVLLGFILLGLILLRVILLGIILL